MFLKLAPAAVAAAGLLTVGSAGAAPTGAVHADNGPRCFFRVYSNANNFRASVSQFHDLFSCALSIGSVCVGHGLNNNGVISTH